MSRITITEAENTTNYEKIRRKSTRKHITKKIKPNFKNEGNFKKGVTL